MKRRIYTFATVLLISMLAISPVYAGGVSIKIGLGSITAEGTAWGFGKDAVIILDGSGIPLIECYAPGTSSNPAPGQNPPRLFVSDSQPASDGWVGKGKFTVNLDADAPDITSLPATDFGCPNNNWTADIAFVFWDSATISVVNAKGDLQYQQNYSCVTTYNPNTISCTPAP